jgi:zinc transporter ZupT
MAFLLVCIAGLCAPLGACVVLFINTDKHVAMLPGGLALAAGVMVLVSIYEVRLITIVVK